MLSCIEKDLTSLNGEATQQKAELVALEWKVQKQNEKMLKFMEQIDSVLDCINKLEDQVEEWDKKIQVLEQEVEDLQPKVCWCANMEEDIDVPKVVKRGHRICLKHSDPLLYR